MCPLELLNRGERQKNSFKDLFKAAFHFRLSGSFESLIVTVTVV